MLFSSRFILFIHYVKKCNNLKFLYFFPTIVYKKIIVDRVQAFVLFVFTLDLLENRNVNRNAAWMNILGTIHKEIKSIDDLPNPMKFYQNCINRTTKLWNEFLDCMLVVGQLQLLKNLIAFHLSKSCKFNAKSLDSSLRALNE